MLQSEVEEITTELTSARGQLAEEGELYTNEINKLRNAMREMEQAYDSNLRNLEEELSAMSKELTALKFSRETGNSRLRGSRQSDGGDEKSTRRFEEKIKLKDRRID
jgi:ribosomal protein L29